MTSLVSPGATGRQSDPSYALPIDGQQAREFLDTLDTSGELERQAKENALRAYADRLREEKLPAIKKAYTDPDGWWKTEGGDKVPDEIKHEIANRRFIAHAFGQTTDEQAKLYPSARDQYFLETFGKVPSSESEAYETIQGSLRAQEAVQGALRELPSVLALNLMRPAASGTDSPELASLDLFSEWKDRHADILSALPEDWESRAMEQAESTRREITALMREIGPEAKQAWDMLQKWTRPEATYTGDAPEDRRAGRRKTVRGRPKDAAVENDDPVTREEIETLAQSLANMPDALQDRLFGALYLAAEATGAGMGKGFFEKIGEGLVRGGVRIYDEAVMAGEDRRARHNLQQLRGSQPVYEMEDGRVGTQKEIVGSTPSGQSEIRQMLANAEFQDGKAPPPIASERREELIAANEHQLKELATLRKIRQLAEGAIDPLKTEVGGFAGSVIQGAYTFSQSASYTAMAAIPLVGFPAVAYSLGNSNYLRMLDEYPDIDPDFAYTLSMAIAAPQAAVERFRANALLGKSPALNALMKKLTDARVPLAGRIAAGYGSNVLYQTGQEFIQEAMPTMADQIAAAIREDMPEFDAKQAWGAYLQEMPEIFFSMLWAGLLGGSVVTLREFKRDGIFLTTVGELEMVGVVGETARDVAAETDIDAKNEKLKAALNNRRPEDIKAGIAKRAAMFEAAGREQGKELPTRHTATDAEGNLVHVIYDQQGNELLRTGDTLAADVAYIGMVRQMMDVRADNDTAVVRDLVDQWLAGDDARTVVEGKPETAAERLAKLEAEQNTEQIEVLHRRIVQAGLSETPYDQINILGEASVQDVGEMVFRSVIALNANSRPQDAREEMHHVGVRIALGKGEVTLETLREWLAQTEDVLGQEFARDTIDDIVESIAVVQRAFEDGKINADQETGLPPSFVDYIKRMLAAFAEVMRRAVALRTAFDTGVLSSDYEAFLAKTTGVNEQAIVDTARETAGAALAGSNYSIDSAGGARLNPNMPENNRAAQPADGQPSQSGLEAEASYSAKLEKALLYKQRLVEDALNKSGIFIRPAKIGPANWQEMHNLRDRATEAAAERNRWVEVQRLNNTTAYELGDGSWQIEPDYAIYHRSKRDDSNFNPFLLGEIPEDQWRLMLAEFNGISSHIPLFSDESRFAHIVEADNYTDAVNKWWNGVLNASQEVDAEMPILQKTIRDLEKLALGEHEIQIASTPLKEGFSIKKEGDKWRLLNPHGHEMDSADGRLTEQQARVRFGMRYGNVIFPNPKSPAPTEGAANLSISSQSQMARVSAALAGLNRGPRERLGIYERAKVRLEEVLGANWEILRGLKGVARPEEIRRTQILQTFGVLDAVLQELPPEVRGKIGFTSLADISPVDLFKGKSKVSEANTMRGAIIGAWMREGMNIGEAGKQTTLPRGYSTRDNLDPARADKAIVDALRRKFEAVDRALEKTLRDDYRERIEKLLEAALPKKDGSRILKGRLTPETAALVQEADRLRSLSPGQAADKIQSLYEQLDAAKDPDAIAALVDELSLVQMFADFKSLNSTTLADSNAWLSEIVQRGRDIRKVLDEERAARIHALRETAVAEFSGGQGILPQPVEVSRTNRRRTQKVRQAAYNFHLKNQSFEWLLNAATRPDKTVGTLAGKTTQHFSKLVHRATHQERRRRTARERDAHERLAKIFGVKTGLDLSSQLYKWRSEINYASGVNIQKTEEVSVPVEVAQRAVEGIAPLDFTKKELAALADALNENEKLPPRNRKGSVEIRRIKGGQTELALSQDTALYYYMLSKQDGPRESLEHWGWDETSFAALEEFLSPETRKIHAWLSREYHEGYGRINEVYRQVHNVNMPRVANYSPVNYVIDAKLEENLMDNDHMMSSSSPAFIRARVRHRAEVKERGALDMYFRHLVDSEHYVAWALPMRDLRGVLGHKDVQRAVTQQQGGMLVNLINDKLDQFAAGGRKAAFTMPMLDAIRGSFVIAKQSFNWGVMIKQLTSFPAYMFDIPVKDFFKYESEFWKDPLAATKKIASLPFVKQRFGEGFDRDMLKVTRQFEGLDAPRTRLARAAEWGMIAVKSGDIVPVIVGGYSAYRYKYDQVFAATKDAKQAEAEAVTYFEMVTERAQQAGDVKDLSFYQSGGSIARMLSMFKTAPRQYYSNVFESMLDWRAGKEGAGAEFARRLFIGQVVLPVFFQMAGDLVRNAFREPDERELDPMDYLRAIAVGPFNGLFVIGGILESASYWFLKGRWFDDTQLTGLSEMNRAYRGVGRIGKMIQDREITPEQVAKTLDDLATATSSMAGGGYTWYDIGRRLIRSVGMDDEMGELTGDFLDWAEDKIGRSP